MLIGISAYLPLEAPSDKPDQSCLVCAGPFISQLISPPEKVQRKDGVKIELRKTTLTETLAEFWKVISNKNVRPCLRS